jgi:hypothetical protein
MGTAKAASRALLRLGLPLLAALAFTACGGGSGSGARHATSAPTRDADALVKQAAGRNRAARSGRIDAEITFDLKGAAGFAKPFSTTLSGAFRVRNGSALPDYEIDMGVRDNGVELSSVDGRSYVSLGSTGYELPARVRTRLVRASARGANGLTRTLEQFGIAPARWETDRRIAGSEQLDGVQVVHITTGFTAGRILKDANTLLGLLASMGIARATGLPASITSRARRIIVRGVRIKQGESWIGLRDKVLRKAGFTMTFKVPTADRSKVGGISAGTIHAELDVSEVGKAQRIRPPDTLRPFSEFELALDTLGDARQSRSDAGSP